MQKSVYAIVGDEPYLQARHLRAILDQFKEPIDRVDVDGERAALGDVLDELRSFAMFGGRKVVIVRDADKFISLYREPLEDYLAKPVDTATLILRAKSLPAVQRVYKLIAKCGQIVKCEPPSENAIGPWIVAHARDQYGITLAPDAVKMLAELIGPDLGRLDRELSKLALLAEGGKVSAAIVDQNVAFQHEQEMSTLLKALSTGNVTATIRKWRELLQTDPAAEFRAVTWLFIWLQRVMRARELAVRGMKPADIAREAKIWPPDEVHACLRMAERLGDQRLAAALAELVEVDARCKSSLGEPAANIERFMLSLR